MDKRIEKTQKAIKEAFIKLRAKKPLEKISIKELCEIAYINKSTFYSHYENIYALSDALEYELVLSIISSIPRNFDYTFTNPEVFTREITLAFANYLPLSLSTGFHLWKYPFKSFFSITADDCGRHTASKQWRKK